MHKILYRSELPLQTAMAQIAALQSAEGSPTEDTQQMLDFLQAVNPQRGIVR